MKTYKDLIVWQKAYSLAVSIYKITKVFPVNEIYGLTSQLRRASVSIASNLAEGSKRGTKKDFAQFIRIAQGSTAEIETQLMIAKEIDYLNEKDFNLLMDELNQISRMLTGLLMKI
ncbi:TPA: four helix bundle protein [Candidatus Nomurabacteria bacterium]|nr:four helix bundle protein [Candidatus Nomurabacteria bacterium]